MKELFLLLSILFTAVLLTGMKPLSDGDLAGVSGAAGVSIMMDITLSLHIDNLAWGDSDGLGADNVWGVQTTGGYLVVTDLSVSGLSIRNSSNSISFWPAPTAINIYNGKPYYRVNLDAGQP